MITVSNTLCFVLSIFILTACAVNPISSTSENPPILTKLAEIEGEFVWNEALGRHVYSKMALVERVLAPEVNDELILLLANCIDNAAPSNSTLNGRPVQLGFMCYQGLSQVAYYEATDNAGDIKRYWRGHILPTAALHERREAKRAWLEVINDKTYIRY